MHKNGKLPKRWKTAKIFAIAKPGKENSRDLSNYRPISLLEIRGKCWRKSSLTG